MLFSLDLYHKTKILQNIYRPITRRERVDGNSENIELVVTNMIDDVVQNAINVYYPNPVYNPPYSYENLIALGNSIGIVQKGIKNIDLVAPIINTLTEIKCPICMDNTKEIRKTVCGHSFCCHCIEKWLKTNIKCPVCMKSLDEFDINITEEPDNEDIYADE